MHSIFFSSLSWKLSLQNVISFNSHWIQEQNDDDDNSERINKCLILPSSIFTEYINSDSPRLNIFHQLSILLVFVIMLILLDDYKYLCHKIKAEHFNQQSSAQPSTLVKVVSTNIYTSETLK